MLKYPKDSVFRDDFLLKGMSVNFFAVNMFENHATSNLDNIKRMRKINKRLVWDDIYFGL